MRNQLKILILICSLFLAGCKIDYESESIVGEDGSIQRTSVYKIVDEQDKKVLLDIYELPPNGIWTQLPAQSDQLKTGEPAEAYIFKNNFGLNKQPASDFKRFNKSKNKYASNEFHVKAEDFWVVKFFHYEEKFIDIVDNNKREKILRRIFDDGLSEFRTQLSSEITDLKLLDQISEQLKTKLEPLFNRFISIVNEFGFDSQKFEESGELKGGQDINKIIAEFLQGQFPELRNERYYDLIINSLNKTVEILGEKYKYFEEDIFGVHGFNIFDTYDFKVSLQMPGVVTRTNAYKKEKRNLIWEFNGTNLNQRLVADSRKIYIARLIVVMLAFICLIVIMKRSLWTKL